MFKSIRAEHSLRNPDCNGQQTLHLGYLRSVVEAQASPIAKRMRPRTGSMMCQGLSGAAGGGADEELGAAARAAAGGAEGADRGADRGADEGAEVGARFGSIACMSPSSSRRRPATGRCRRKSQLKVRSAGAQVRPWALAGLAYLRRATPHKTCPRLAACPGPQPFTAKR